MAGASLASLKLGSKSEVFQRQGQTWICNSGLPSDVLIEIGEMSFHLHKFPLLSRSGTLEKMIEGFSSDDGSSCVLQLHDLPGGAKAFEIIARFCYGVKVELNAANIVCVRCAAEQLQMTEEYGERNLIFDTENFLNELFCSWKDSLKILETCEEVLPHAEELHIVTRCINSLAIKASAEPNSFGLPMVGCDSVNSPRSSYMWNGIGTDSKPRATGADWWYEDVSFLGFSLYKRFISAVELRGMKPECIAGSLINYAKRHIPGLIKNSTLRDGTNRITSSVSSGSSPAENDQKTLLEEIVSMLPANKGVTPTTLLLGMLRTGLILHASTSCCENLEKRVGSQLDDAALEDLLIPNLSYSAETLYDVDCVQRILDHFMLVDQSVPAASPNIIIDEGQLMGSAPSLTPVAIVAKLIDGYLAEVAPDVNLKFSKFQSLAAAIPDYARPLDDGIYRAIDIYLKAHPSLTDSEREHLCRLMNCQKLSLEACTHAAQNERLPLRMVVQVLFFEQLRLRTSIASWFFVSDSLDNSHSANGNLVLSKHNNGRLQSETSQELKELGFDDMKLRVNELEKECSNLKQEMEKMGKPKSSWSSLSRKLGLRLKTQPFCSGEEAPVNCQKDSRSTVKSQADFLER